METKQDWLDEAHTLRHAGHAAPPGYLSRSGFYMPELWVVLDKFGRLLYTGTKQPKVSGKLNSNMLDKVEYFDVRTQECVVFNQRLREYLVY